MIRPSRREFRELFGSGKRVPVAACLDLEASAEELFQAVDFGPPHFLLESARLHPVTGRYSILAGEPTSSLTAKGDRVWLKSAEQTEELQGRPLELLQQFLDSQPAVRIPGFPPFVGGAIGFLGFDAFRYIEPLPSRAQDDLGLPDLAFFFFDEAIVVDHLKEELWVIALAQPSGNPDRSYDDAVGKVEALVRRVSRCAFDRRKAGTVPIKQGQSPLNRLSESDRAGTVPISTHTRASFEAMVRQAKVFIADGEIYQANLSQRFALPLAESPWVLYRRLREINPSPFAGFADCGFLQIVSGSPERFLRVQGRRVETRPIAGTRPKGTTAVETARLRQELILNEKERAEHLMLVDLERNDLGRVCRYGSVRVDEFEVLEEYSHVIHIVSNVRGTLRPQVRPVALIAAAFPGGTITGCPKIRSIEVIDALEPVRRQLYTGALGYISASGAMDFNLLIRTAFAVNDTVYLQAGAGIVADSDPSKEYEETLHKAQALMEMIRSHHDAVCSGSF